MTDLQVFNNPEFGEVRTMEIEGEGWFVGTDVAKALGYAKPQHAIVRNVDEDDCRMSAVMDSLGRMQQTRLINESGLYSLVILSELPSAKKFKRWVTSEVLPSIRKTGGYMIPQTLPDALRLAADLAEKNSQLEQKIEQQKPQVLLAEAVTASDNCISVNELAKILKQNGVNTGRNRLFEWLRSNGFLIKSYGDEYNLPTQRSMDMGLFEIDSCPIIQHGEIITKRTTKVTRKGQAYFIQRFCYETA